MCGEMSRFAEGDVIRMRPVEARLSNQDLIFSAPARKAVDLSLTFKVGRIVS